MSIIDDFSRRWTDILWSGVSRIRDSLHGNEVRRIYYGILIGYVAWSLICFWAFSVYGSPKLMTIVIANLNNVAIGVTSFHLLHINRTLLPPALRPRWFQQLGLLCCGLFYVGLSLVVFYTKQLPDLRAWWQATFG
jgi:hypothetical protein